MEITKFTFLIYLDCFLVALIAIGCPFFATAVFWGHLHNPSAWIVIGMCCLPFPSIFYVPGMIKKARNKIIMDREGIIFEDISSIKLKWDDVETFQLEKLGRIRYLAIITKPNTGFAENYWRNNRGLKTFNKIIIRNNGVLFALNAYIQRPEKILSILLEGLKNAVTLKQYN